MEGVKMDPEIRKHRPKGTEIKKIGNGYYVCKISSVWDKEKKKVRKVSGACIGKITLEDGFIPNEAYSKELAKERVLNDENNRRIYEYGATELMESVSKDILQKLRVAFPTEFRRIYTLAILEAIEPDYKCEIKNTYDSSYYSKKYPGIALSKNTLTKFFNDLGRWDDKMFAYMESCVANSSNILLDSTSISNFSVDNPFTEYGFSYKGKKYPSFKMLAVFDADTNFPVYCSIHSGNIIDSKILDEISFGTTLKDTIVIADRGFSKYANLDYFDEVGINYVMPLNSNNRFIKPIMKSGKLTNPSCDSIYVEDTFYYIMKEKIKDRYFYYYFSKKLAYDHENRMRKNIEDTPIDDEDIQKEVDKISDLGYVTLVSNMDMDSKTAFLLYKKRWNIEIAFNTFKNKMNFNATYATSKETTRAISFIRFVAWQIYYCLANKVTELKVQGKLNEQWNPEKVLRLASKVSICTLHNEKITTKLTLKEEAVLNLFGIQTLPIPK
jgi:outer membrane protein assembly factor BamE (lipoprotein component of BamABCDE complex)